MIIDYELKGAKDKMNYWTFSLGCQHTAKRSLEDDGMKVKEIDYLIELCHERIKKYDAIVQGERHAIKQI